MVLDTSNAYVKPLSEAPIGSTPGATIRPRTLSSSREQIKEAVQAAAAAAAPASSAQAPDRQLDMSEPLPSAAPSAETKKPEEEVFSPKFAALAKREKMLRRLDQDLKAKEEALKLKESTYQSSSIPKERLKSDLLAVLQEQGISGDELTNLLLNQPSPQDRLVRELQTKLDALENQQKQVSETFEKNQTQAYENALHQIRLETKALISNDPNFETIKTLGTEEAVVELIRQTFDQEGRLISVEEAAKEVEDHLVEEAFKMASLSKVKQRLAPAPAPAETGKSLGVQTPPARTLTHGNSASGKPLTPRERALLAFEGKL